MKASLYESSTRVGLAPPRQRRQSAGTTHAYYAAAAPPEALFFLSTAVAWTVRVRRRGSGRVAHGSCPPARNGDSGGAAA